MVLFLVFQRTKLEGASIIITAIYRVATTSKAEPRGAFETETDGFLFVCRPFVRFSFLIASEDAPSRKVLVISGCDHLAHNIQTNPLREIVNEIYVTV